MLVLPSGQVLFSNTTNQLYVFTPGQAPVAAAVPTISGITQNSDGSFLLSGTQLNGINEGAAYGDDAEMSSNYPIVRLTDPSGKVFFGRTYNWSSNGVATGTTTPESTDFTLPIGLPANTYQVAVVANGVASTSVSITIPTNPNDPGSARRSRSRPRRPPTPTPAPRQACRSWAPTPSANRPFPTHGRPRPYPPVPSPRRSRRTARTRPRTTRSSSPRRAIIRSRSRSPTSPSAMSTTSTASIRGRTPDALERLRDLLGRGRGTIAEERQPQLRHAAVHGEGPGSVRLGLPGLRSRPSPGRSPRATAAWSRDRPLHGPCHRRPWRP